MKKSIFALGLLVLAVSCNTPQKGYEVSGTLQDSTLNGTTAYIFNYEKRANTDSTIVSNSSFKFKGVQDTAAYCQVRVGKKFANLILENGNITVDLEKRNAEGTFLNSEVNAINAFVDSIYSVLDKKEEDLANQGTAPEEISKQMQEAFLAAKDVMFNKALETVKAHNDDAVSTFILRSNLYPRTNPDQAETLLNALGDRIKSSDIAQYYINLNSAKKKSMEGKPFIDFKGKNAEGQEVSLSDYVGKGKYVLVDFWASWCSPCRKELPNLKKANELYKNKDLQLLGIFVWDEDANLASTVEVEGLTWPQIIAGDKTGTSEYGIDGIPHIILFAPDGTILKRNLRGEGMLRTLEEILGKK